MNLKNLKLQNIFVHAGSNELVGIDLSTNSFKIAQMMIYPNKKELVWVKSFNIGGISEDEIVKSIQSSLKESKISNPEVVLSIPSHLVITKNIEVPSTNDKEIREIINLQAGRHTPYTREEIIIDYLPIGTFKQNYTKILFLIVTNSVIKKQLAILEKAGLRIKNVFLAQEAMAIFASKNFKLDNEATPIGIAHIDQGSTDFMIVNKSRAIFIRSIPIGKEQLSAEEEKFQSKFAAEIKKSLEAYQAENIEKNPNLLILTGAIEELGSTDTVLNQTLELPVRKVSYAGNLSLKSNAADGIGAAPNLSFLNVISCLWTYPELKVNLIPEEIRIKMALRQRSKDLVVSGVLILVILIMVFTLLISNIYFKSVYLKNLNAQYQTLARDAKKLEELAQKNSLVRSYLSGRGVSFEVLVALHEIAPIYLELNDIRFEKDGKFVLRGTAESMSTVFTFVDALSKSKYFKDVKTKYTTRRQEGKKDLTDFEINSLLGKVVR